MNKKTVKTTGDEIAKYSKSQIKQFAEICERLRIEIDKILTNATSRVYYSMPVWFVDDNPVVAYKVSSKHVLLLFWSGQSFNEPDLIASGKFKAAMIRYRSADEIDVKALRRWLKKSKINIWDYKNIRENRGKLNKVK